MTELEKILNDAVKELKKVARHHRESKAGVKALMELVEKEKATNANEDEDAEKIKEIAERKLKELYTSFGMEFKKEN